MACSGQHAFSAADEFPAAFFLAGVPRRTDAVNAARLPRPFKGWRGVRDPVHLPLSSAVTVTATEPAPAVASEAAPAAATKPPPKRARRVKKQQVVDTTPKEPIPKSDTMPESSPPYWYVLIPERVFLYEEPMEEIFRERSQDKARLKQPYDFWVTSNPYILSSLRTAADVKLCQKLSTLGQRCYAVITSDYYYARFLRLRLRDGIMGGPLRLKRKK